MNELLLHTDVQQFIDQNLNEDLTSLVLKGSPFKDIPIQELVRQIESKKKARLKLPSWYGSSHIYYPPKLNIAQASSEVTAQYKSSLISGTSLIDLTGGFGVDAFYFSKTFDTVRYCEINAPLADIVAHNYRQLASRVRVLNIDGLHYLTESAATYDWIYLDPSRRSSDFEKVFMLQDCVPNLIQCQSLLFDHTKCVMAKLSPLLDITSALRDLNSVAELHCIAVSNEVKELLLLLKKGHQGAIQLKTVNIKGANLEYFNAVLGETNNAQYSLPLKFLYEPNAAILKAGLFNEVSYKLNVFKLHSNSHLYTNNELINFPGRRFKILYNVSYDEKKIKSFLPGDKANITTRNFPDSVAKIRKKTKIKEGGQQYLFATTDLNNKPIVLICEKL